MKKSVLRSTGAVLAGLIAIILLSSLTDGILEATGVFPTVAEQQRSGFNEGWMQLLALTYRFLYAVLGGYVTAKLAPIRPMLHIIILAMIGTVLGILGTLAAASMEIFSVWYSVALIVSSFPALWLGGKLGTNGQRVHAV